MKLVLADDPQVFIDLFFPKPSDQYTGTDGKCQVG